MRVLSFNTRETGGAARAAWRLHSGLQQAGADAQFVVKSKTSQAADVIEVPFHETRSGLRHAIGRRLDWRHRRRYFDQQRTSTFYSECVTRYRPEHFAGLPQANVYQLHWLATFVDWQSTLPWMLEQAPVVWTQHDMNALFGIWHYAPSSEEVTPDLAYLEHQSRLLKEALFSSLPADRLVFVSPSNWLAELIRKEPMLARFRTEVIPNSVEIDVFQPLDKKLARQALGLEETDRVVGFASESLEDERKGAALLGAALDQLPAGDFVSLSVGSGIFPVSGSRKHMSLGSLQSDRLLALFYAALDVFVIPSLQDNLPNTVLEAMACGTPVVGFDIGGIPDMVRPGQTGWLAPAKDVSALAACIKEALESPRNTQQLGLECRRVVEAEYTATCQSQRYLELYESLLGGDPV